ncbi:MAG: divalent-cation tolerance protein CutA [Candidatus Heimdallarchaeota archaeon]|nr:divalent-cation tolerance protein CutA [Candidatus Heimdallarchaeota archaeon]MCK4954970.1 divalent-cation tolerance protein CutA [Candidatus Heimdallarchaeota archaeon]
MKGKIVQIKTTVNTEEEAIRISKELVENKFAACVQFFPISSYYRWKGQIEKSEEFLLLIKSDFSKYEDVEKKIKEIHSYELPEIEMIPIEKASSEYLNWVFEETS